MNKIDVNKFNKTINRLMSNFNPPRVATSFERKVGASLSRVSELAMIDLKSNPEKPNMIVKAFESKLVQPIAQYRGWKRMKSMD